MVLDSPLQRVVSGVVVAAFALASLSPVAHAEQSSILLVTIHDPGSGHVRVEQVRSGADADAFRQSLDALFGDGDATLTEKEIANITNATETDLANQSLPVLSFDGTLARITHANVKFEDATGPVKSGSPMGIEHDLDVQLTPAADEGAHVVVVTPPHDGVLTLELPQGWSVTESTNLTDAETPEPGRIGGKITAGSEVTLVLAADSTVPDASGASDGDAVEESVTDDARSMESRDVVALFAPFVLLAGVAGALLQKRSGTRRRRGRGVHPVDREDEDRPRTINKSRGR